MLTMMTFRWGSSTGHSSLFGSPVHHPDLGVCDLPDDTPDVEQDLSEDPDDDTSTYILLHAEDVRRAARPPTPFAAATDGARDALRPTASKLGHRRRSSVAMAPAGWPQGWPQADEGCEQDRDDASVAVAEGDWQQAGEGAQEQDYEDGAEQDHEDGAPLAVRLSPPPGSFPDTPPPEREAREA